MTSLNPALSVGEQVAERLRLHQYGGQKPDTWANAIRYALPSRGDDDVDEEVLADVIEMLEQVGIPEPTTRLVHDPRMRALVLGFGLGFVAVPAFISLAGWIPREATSTAFALGALVLGFAVISWTGAVMLGPAVESLHDYMDLASGWTEAGARQSFAILSALGFGVMLGSSIASMLV